MVTAKRYRAIEVVQQPSADPMYLISTSANDLLAWCDVPRTKEQYMAGYQRLLTPARADDIAAYLKESPRNLLPGAVIVATDKEYVSIERNGEEVFVVVEEDTRDFKTKV